MEEQLLDFIRNLKSDNTIKSYDEVATKQAIILQCLALLGWNTYKIEEVYPEYKLGKDKKVDFSLRIDGKNKVFLEIKRVGEELEKESYQKQLLNYSFEEGVELAILTDGIKWWFYLPMQKANWEQRKFYIIDVYQQDPKDMVSKFRDFLSKENITNGVAFDNAEAEYNSQRIQEILESSLPKAWNMLISEPDELLVELLNETTEKICGYRADNDTIKRFLSFFKGQLAISGGLSEIIQLTPLIQIPTKTHKSRIQSKDTENYKSKKISSFYFQGQEYKANTWKELLLGICEIMNTLHRSDFDKVFSLKGSQRVYFTKEESELREPRLIPNTNIFVETNMNANYVIQICQRIISLFGYNKDDLDIVLKPE